MPTKPDWRSSSPDLSMNMVANGSPDRSMTACILACSPQREKDAGQEAGGGGHEPPSQAISVCTAR